ncbi:hypothetical protein [Glycomyces dulcitolivorans]|uniref:hypothetical protein n=1 Tax=Glycomyces dulcitolivorans TaxID=2200759 RepID=UPI000DD4EAB4|nr:hypothetical protein [Glycomyces dulcitolivorans]
MRGRGSDQGGRWPVGIWFALVGVSAGTVASFAMIGWTFTRGLYTGGDGAEPVEIESGTVVIEGEEPPADPGGIEGIAGGDPVPDGLAEPGAGIDPEPAEPQAGPLPEPEDAPGPPVEESEEEREPPQLVPVDEDKPPCAPEESTGEPEDPGHDWDGGDDDWDDHWDDGWDSGWDEADRPDWNWDEGRGDSWDDSSGADPSPEPELDLQADLQAPQEDPLESED